MRILAAAANSGYALGQHCAEAWATNMLVPDAHYQKNARFRLVTALSTVWKLPLHDQLLFATPWPFLAVSISPSLLPSELILSASAVSDAACIYHTTCWVLEAIPACAAAVLAMVVPFVSLDVACSLAVEGVASV
jgi:hypothetical protein